MENLLKELKKNENKIRQNEKNDIFVLFESIKETINAEIIYLETVYENDGYPCYELWYDDGKLVKKEPTDYIKFGEQEDIGQYYYKSCRLPYLMELIKDVLVKKIEKQKEVLNSQIKLSKIIELLKD